MTSMTESRSTHTLNLLIGPCCNCGSLTAYSIKTPSDDGCYKYLNYEYIPKKIV